MTEHNTIPAHNKNASSVICFSEVWQSRFRTLPSNASNVCICTKPLRSSPIFKWCRMDLISAVDGVGSSAAVSSFSASSSSATSGPLAEPFATISCMSSVSSHMEGVKKQYVAYWLHLTGNTVQYAVLKPSCPMWSRSYYAKSL